jgi:hypothetical protein
MGFSAVNDNRRIVKKNLMEFPYFHIVLFARKEIKQGC